MSFSSRFISRPAGTTLLALAMLLAGGAAFFGLPVSPLPAVDFPTIAVGAALPGASAAIMAATVATPLERQFGRIAGITEMTSTSSLGQTQITLQFDLGRDIDGASRDVEAAISAARAYLPTNLPGNPTYRKVNPSDAPIMILALTSDKYGAAQLYDAAATVIQQRLSQISGVGQVLLAGSALPAVRVDINPTQLAHYGLALSAVQRVLSAQNDNLPKGRISVGDVKADILANDQMERAAQYRDLVVGTGNGAVVRLRDVADVSDSVQDVRVAGYLNGERAVLLIVFRQPGANIIDTVDAIRAALPSMRASIASDIGIDVAIDRTVTIRASVRDVERTLLISTVLVVLVVFLFLRNLRATLIPGIAMPAALIGTFAVMYLAGYSLDNLSLMSLTIATGFVVDDAIVVMENIVRHVEGGMAPREAAERGAGEIGSTVFTISISLVAVFIPLLLMGGIVGRLFREFAMTLSIAILVSMAVSLTLTPMMCSRMIRGGESAGAAGVMRWFERGFDAMLAFYRRTLALVLEHRRITLAVLLFTIVLNGALIVVIPKGFFPLQDTGTLVGGVQGREDASFAYMDRSMRRIGEVVGQDPAMQNVITYTPMTSTNTGNVFVGLTPLEQRGVNVSQVIDRLRPRLNALPVASTYLQATQDLRIGGRRSNSMYQYTLLSDSQEELQKWGPLLLEQMRRLPGLLDVNTDQQNGGLDEYLDFDRASAARLGLTAQGFDGELYQAFGQAEVSVIYKPSNYYYVVLGVAPRYWQDPAGLDFLYLPAGHGAVPVAAVARRHATTTALTVNHSGMFPSVTLSFNLAPGVALSQATAAIGQLQRRLGMPGSIQGYFAGTLQAYQQSLSSEPLLIAAALVSVYIVLGMLYESLIHPLTIISSLPPASVGAMLALMIGREDLNVISIIGIVLLIGLVKKNAILMVDFALQARRTGASTHDAIFQACLLRFRPIMMTTAAALLGAVPLAVGTGTGSELRRPLGISIIGGLIVSQVLTLYTTPVVYLYMDRLGGWWQRRRGPARATVPA